jgi:hypothetical protein
VVEKRRPEYTPETTEKKMTDTPRTDACPHCGSPRISPLCAYFTCKADTTQRDEDKRTHLCREREKSQKLKAEVERLRSQLERAVEIADEFWNNQKQAVLIHHQELAEELEQIKELEKSKGEIK